VSRLIRIQGIGIQAYSGAPPGWDREHIITLKVKLRTQVARSLPSGSFLRFVAWYCDLANHRSKIRSKYLRKLRWEIDQEVMGNQSQNTYPISVPRDLWLLGMPDMITSSMLSCGYGSNRSCSSSWSSHTTSQVILTHDQLPTNGGEDTCCNGACSPAQLRDSEGIYQLINWPNESKKHR